MAIKVGYMILREFHTKAKNTNIEQRCSIRDEALAPTILAPSLRFR